MTVIPRRLTGPEHRAVKHLLARSALADCPGRIGRLQLSDEGDLTIQRLDSWGWSSGEWVLIEVLQHILGECRWPDISRVDEHEQLIVRESMRLLVREPAS